MKKSDGLQRSPFWLRRPGLLLEGFRVDRDSPDIPALQALEPAERYVWGVLPHAARSFAPCILALPSTMALPAALGYLYCRILDTHEDLIEDEPKRRRALEHVCRRLRDLSAGATPCAPPEAEHMTKDSRDDVHVMIAHNISKLDALFLSLGSDEQRLILELVEDMAKGMLWASDAFEAQGGVLSGEQQVRRYCEAVLGNPILFAARLYERKNSTSAGRPSKMREACMDVGEFLQLANVTRDIEKDLARGVAYDETLRPHLGQAPDDAATPRVQALRLKLLVRALSLAPAYLELVTALKIRRGWMAASSLIMARFTERYYLNCAARAGVNAPRPASALIALTGCWPALLSSAWAIKGLEAMRLRQLSLREESSSYASSMNLS